MAKHGNIAIFVPHSGCPHQCSFCNQRTITGQQRQPTAQDVHDAVQTALNSAKTCEYEIAFFGGSFTAIDRDYMISLLEAAHIYVKSGDVMGIRLSTRPDAVDSEVLSILKRYGVTAIELGAQSMSDEVLRLNERGHTAADVENASRLIRSFGFSLGLQMMTGLYGSTPELDRLTAERIIALAPDTVRIYPTVVLRGTALARHLADGSYAPMPLSESVNLCASLLAMFRRKNIEVIRLGLHYSGELSEQTLYDNYHPAFRELCESRLLRDKFLTRAKGISGSTTVRVHPSCVSQFIGQKRENITALRTMGYEITVQPDSSVDKGDVVVDS